MIINNLPINKPLNFLSSDSRIAVGAVGSVGNLREFRFSTDSMAHFSRLLPTDSEKEPIYYTKEDFVARVKEITGGRGVDVVYDGVGRATFPKSLDCLKPRGLCVLFGQSSGSVDPYDLTLLNKKGSLYVTRPGIDAYIATREELCERADEVFGLIEEGVLNIRISHTYPLNKAKEAHQDLEARRTTGKVILYP